MPWIMVDVEADGPAPGLFSMISFGAILVAPPNRIHGANDEYRGFLGHLKPISEDFVPEALAVSGVTREQTLTYMEPGLTMTHFDQWLKTVCAGKRPMFIADNNGFDWQFINYYFWKFLGRNPFGHSSTNLGSLYKGMVKDTFKNFKHLRKTKHTHNPLDDSRGNVEAFLHMLHEMGLKG